MPTPSKIRRAPYKDFLQAALQRRFVLASSIALVIAYFEAVLVGSWNSFIWAWFPVFRTFLFFLCAFTILVGRIAHYHVGIQTSTSPLQHAASSLLKAKTCEIVATYALSGWLFGQVYLWSAAERDGLQWITYAHHTADRPRLNEKPILFSTYFALLGACHAIYHVTCDLDSLPLGSVGKDKDRNEDRKDVPLTPLRFLTTRLPSALTTAASSAVLALLIHTALYAVFLRPVMWRWSMWFLRGFYNLPKSNLLPSTYPYHLWLFAKMNWIGFLLSFLWVGANQAFSEVMNAEPLKHGKPITSESKDPNASLLTGILSKKASHKAFAMWELAVIARDFPDRRKSIFEDIDRKDGPMWRQVYQACMETIQAVQYTIDAHNKPPETPEPPKTNQDQHMSEHPKKRVSRPPKEDAIFDASLQPSRDGFALAREVQKQLDHVGRSPGKTVLGSLSPKAKKAVSAAREMYLSKEQREALTKDKVTGRFHVQVVKLLSTGFGYPLRHDFGRSLTAAVFAEFPHCEVSLYVNAVNVLTQLSVNSLSEDKYGHVQRDVASIIRTFTSVTTKLEKFKEDFPMHWMDVKKERQCEEVDMLVSCLKRGLWKLLDAFGDYADDLRLGRADIRLARDATRGCEMVEVR